MAERFILSNNSVRKLINGRIVRIDEQTTASLNALTKKQKAIRSRGIIIADAQENLIMQIDKQLGQHFFPLSMIDYANVAYQNARNGAPFPIISVDSHDVLHCDFACKDCLSGAGKNIEKACNNYNFNLPIELYKHMLQEISNYSTKRGFHNVRFEQSGEGNPDLYKSRAKLIEFAKQKLGMGIVYVSSGSKLDNSQLSSLVENVDFIRISFPGISPEAYQNYSGQTSFTFKDSIKNLEKIISERDKIGRKETLLVGVRATLRPEHENEYLPFVRLLNEVGIDAIQLSKVLIPDKERVDAHPLKQNEINNLLECSALSNSYFGVQVPHDLDFLYYGRVIDKNTDFPVTCYSAHIQPVLAGRDLCVCTKSDVMYSSQYSFGQFTGKKDEIESFLSPENFKKTTRDLPRACSSCCSIFDNLLVHNVVTLTKMLNRDLQFWEMIE